MEIFVTDDHRTYVAVSKKLSKDQAITEANKHFRINKNRLGITDGWVRKDTLYFDERSGAKKIWLVWRKSEKEFKS